MDKEFRNMLKFYFQWNNLLLFMLLALMILIHAKPQDSKEINPEFDDLGPNRALFRRNYNVKKEEEVEEGPQIVAPRIYFRTSKRNRTKSPTLPSSTAGDSSIVVSRSQDGKLTYKYQNTREDNKKGNFVPIRGKRATSDRIHFPTDSPDDMKFIPRLGACKGGDTYCEHIDTYPKQRLDEILKSQGDVFADFFGDDGVQSNLAHRIDTPDEETLCTSTELLIHPMAGETPNKDWVFIVNHGKYLQGVRIEKCLYPNDKCAMSDSFPSLYTTECQQKYQFRSLLTYDHLNKTQRSQIKFPSCCKCVIKTIDRRSKRSIHDTRMTPVRRKNN